MSSEVKSTLKMARNFDDKFESTRNEAPYENENKISKTDVNGCLEKNNKTSLPIKTNQQFSENDKLCNFDFIKSTDAEGKAATEIAEYLDVEEYHSMRMNFKINGTSVLGNVTSSPQSCEIYSNIYKKNNFPRSKHIVDTPKEVMPNLSLSEDFSKHRNISSVTIENKIEKKQTCSSDSTSKIPKSPTNSYFKVKYRSVGTNYENFDNEISRSRETVGTQVNEKHFNSQIAPAYSRHEQFTAQEKGEITMHGNPDLCTNCSKSMLSYILIIQQFLNGLTENIGKRIEPEMQCFECKEHLNISHDACNTYNKIKCKSYECRENSEILKIYENQKTYERLPKDFNSWGPRMNKSKAVCSGKTSSEFNKSERFFENTNSKNLSQYLSEQQNLRENKEIDSIFETPGQNDSNNSEQKNILDCNNVHEKHNKCDCPNCIKHLESEFNNETTYQHLAYEQVELKKRCINYINQQQSILDENQQIDINQTLNQRHLACCTIPSIDNHTIDELRAKVQLPHDNLVQSSVVNKEFECSSTENFKQIIDLSRHHCKNEESSLSTLCKVDRNFKNTPKCPSILEQIAEIQNSPSLRVFNEAFITIVKNNAEVLGSLVLGRSLLLSGTSRTLCVLVYGSVNIDFIALLSSIFHEVLHIRSLDCVGTTKLGLLDQPELGVSFAKLNVWRLQQFTKCVYLNPDTMVVQNCDELFFHEELSAVPDIGWPDCFNSGIFVFRPSLKTFWELLEFADKRRNYDGGEQSLLNSYFVSWSNDIHKKLSFIYNLMANVSYTYSPAFKQFGRDVKVVQFLGVLKPWHVKFFSDSGQIVHSSAVHPTYIQFVHTWLNIFRVTIIPLLSPEIQSFVMSQNSLSANEILRFFPSSTEMDVDFLLSPPSVRIKPDQQLAQINGTLITITEKLQLPVMSNSSSNDLLSLCEQTNESNNIIFKNELLKTSNEEVKLESVSDKNKSIKNLSNLKITTKSKRLMPGSEVGDYQGMAAWEQGNVDYEGSASSDTIIQRLSYLIGMQNRLI